MLESNTESGLYCPSCGRYVGHHDICPYCGARVKTRVSLKVIAILAIVISIGGVAALYYAANVKPPTVYIKDINGSMNYARVNIIGYVVSSSTYDPTTGRLYFRMQDINGTYNEKYETSTISVYIYSPTSKELIDKHILPVSGDKVSVTGTLRVRDTISLTINYPEDLVLMRSKPIYTTIDDVANNWTKYIGNSVTVSGWITKYSNKSGMILASIKNYFSTNKSMLSLYVPEVVIRWTGSFPDFFLGDKIRITGNIWEYRGAPELVPWNSSSIEIVEALQISPLKEIYDNETLYADVGVIVKVNATIAGYSSKYPNKIYITDSSMPQGETLTLWVDWSVWDSLSQEQKDFLNTEGNWVVLIGLCKSYKGSFEISVEDPSWIYFDLSGGS